MLRALALMLVFALVALLMGCDSTTPAVARWQHAEVQQGGMTFGVHWDIKLERAEAYRISKHWRPSLHEVYANARIAIERASGCQVPEDGIAGDHAIVKARLQCSGG